MLAVRMLAVRRTESEEVTVAVTEEMKKILDNRISMRETHYIGRTCLGKIDENLRGKIELTKGPLESGFSRIQVSVLERTNGLVDQMTFLIGDVTGFKPDRDCDKLVYPVLSTYENRSSWNCDMTEEDCQGIAEAVNGYLELFQSEELHQGQQGQEMEQPGALPSNLIL